MATKNPSPGTRRAALVAGDVLGKLAGFVLVLLIVKGVGALLGGISWTAAVVLVAALLVLSALRSRIAALLARKALRYRSR